MPIASSDIKFRLSGGAANSTPSASLGGAKSATDAAGNLLFDTVTGLESEAGDDEYRVLYVDNTSGSLEMLDTVLWITSTGSAEFALAVGAAAAGGTEVLLANESTVPNGVVFTTADTEQNGIALGDIPPGSHRGIYIRRRVTAGAAASNVSFNLNVACDSQE